MKSLSVLVCAFLCALMLNTIQPCSAATPSADAAVSSINLPDAVVGAPYHASFFMPCTAPCTYDLQPRLMLPDGSSLRVANGQDSRPMVAFTAQAAATSASLKATLFATGADGAIAQAQLSLKIVGFLIANPTVKGALGSPASPINLPSLSPGTKYGINITVKDGKGCIPAGPISTSAPDGLFTYHFGSTPDLVVDATAGVPAGSYRFSVACGAAIGHFAVNVTDNSMPPAGAASGVAKAPATDTSYHSPCQFMFNDCDWVYSVHGGVEQSGVSAKDNQTNAFADLFIRAPFNVRAGNIWLRARFLGAPTKSDTFNISSAVTDPTGTLKATSLSQVGNAVDYLIGIEHDWLQPSVANPSRGMFTVGFVAAVGATTPLSSQSASIAYAMPDYGTNECNQLQSRFNTNAQSNGIPDPLPGPGSVTNSGQTTFYCSLLQVDSSGNKLSTPIPIKNIAFSPEDRTSFLEKWGAGLRLINRFRTQPNTHCSSRGPGDTGDNAVNSEEAGNAPCVRTIVDFTVGQDEAITGGKMSNWVLKADGIFPISNTGISFYGAVDTRIERNSGLPPLLLNPVPITTSGTSTAGAVTVPSSSVWVLPLRQPNRDFYRYGIAVDLSTVFTKLFQK